MSSLSLSLSFSDSLSLADQIPVLLMFLMLASLTVALLVATCRIAHLMRDRREGGDDRAAWNKAAEEKANEDEDPLLDPTTTAGQEQE